LEGNIPMQKLVRQRLARLALTIALSPTFISVCHRPLRPTPDNETAVELDRVGTEVGLFLVRMSPYLSWTGDPSSTPDCEPSPAGW
jgi:hypothetical protein